MRQKGRGEGETNFQVFHNHSCIEERIDLPPITFAEALQDAQRYRRKHALLGNGFSIACRPDIFRYSRLFEQADFGTISPTARNGFNALDTQDFEQVIKALRDASSLVAAYGGRTDLANNLSADADGLRE